MRYLAFDLGGSGGKLFAGTCDGERLKLETVHKLRNAAIPLKDGLYWDFLNIWRELCEGLQKASRGGGFRSLGLDTFCNDFSFIDKTGDLLAPVRCYRDARTIRCSEAIYEKYEPWRLYQETGNQLAPFNAFMQLASMRLEGKDAILEQAHKLLFLPDLLAYYITGETIAERTIASVSQMYSFKTGDWSQELLGGLGLSAGLFGRLTEPASVSGRAREQFCGAWGVNGFDLVSVCQHDTASAFLAAPDGADAAIISSGTWSLVGCENREPIISEYGFRYNIANEGSIEGHHRLLRNVMGTWLLQELKAEYLREGEAYEYADFEAAAEKAAPFAFLIDVDDPAFFSPGDMRRKIREKCKSKTGEKPESLGQLVRCVCESLALKYRWAVERLEALTGKRLPLVNVIGGGSRDRLTCQMTANACLRPVSAGPAEASAFGNVMAQMIAYGELDNVAQGRELLRRSFTAEAYEPRDAAAWEDAYGEYQNWFGI